MMDLNQTKFYVLVLKLELKAREYNELCKVLENVKKSNIDANDPSLLELKEKFLNNQKEIDEIKGMIQKLNDDYDKKFNVQDMFNKVKTMETTDIRNELNLVKIDDRKDNIFIMILEKIKSIFSNKL